MYLLLTNLGCLIINGSYMLLLQTKTHEGALISLKMEYFGNVVFYLMFGLFLWSYLGLKKHKWIKPFLCLWCAMDVLFLSCCGHWRKDTASPMWKTSCPILRPECPSTTLLINIVC
ncbi:MAG: hypothetical protein K2P59_16410 [Acetatifactor sp.]|nr:hypothetical protein [Acetatifactor sp.]